MKMGYVGKSRSVRSQIAIDNAEVPLNHITKDYILTSVTENNIDETLKNESVAMWKFVAKRHGSTSWHHVSKHYKKIDHYDLHDVAEYFSMNYDSLKNDYQNLLDQKRQAKNDLIKNLKLGIIKVQIWGGTKRYPKLEGYESVMGVVKDGWLHTVTLSNQTKYKITGNKIEEINIFELDQYDILTKKFPEFRAMKRKINKEVARLSK